MAEPAAFAGFTVTDLNNYFKALTRPQVESVLRHYAKQPIDDDAEVIQRIKAQGHWNNIEAGMLHLSQHPAGSRYGGDVSVARILAGTISGGLSEAGYNKPFQAKATPQKQMFGIKGFSGTIFTDPAHAVGKALGRAVTPKGPKLPDAPMKTEPAVQQALAEATQRRSRGRGYRSTFLSQQMMSPNAPALKSTFGE